jgi:HSP20 family molecular chaperone IbpA
MKRLWIILIIFFSLLIGALTSVAQKITDSDPDPALERMKRRLQLRDEMHKRIRDKMIFGFGSDDNLFEGMEQSFGSLMGESRSQFESSWSEDKNGRILTITPKSKDQQLNIDVNESMITINGKVEEKTQTSSMMSSFSNSFSVPHDCDGNKVKMDHKDGKILIFLPFKTASSPTQSPGKPTAPERRPIAPSGDDITI